MTAFVAAFDGVFVNRYDATTREAKEKISVRYINGPKHRVLFDLTDKAKNLTLPVVTIEQTGLTRNTSRVLAKNQSMFRPSIGSSADKRTAKIPVPVPVDLDVNVSIIAYFKEDVDQIIQNFIAYCDPYLIISWKIPEEFGVDFIDEIRSEVQWDGNISYNNPKDLSPDTKWRISADTTFKIKGWLFKEQLDKSAPIYVVNTTFNSVAKNTSFSYDDRYYLSGSDANVDTVMISAYPEITNIFYGNIPKFESFSIESSNDNIFTFYGKRFDYNNSWYLSGSFGSNLQLSEIVTAKGSTISAYKLSDDVITTYNNNVVSISLSSNYLSSGMFTFVTSNSAAWTSSNISVTV